MTSGVRRASVQVTGVVGRGGCSRVGMSRGQGVARLSTGTGRVVEVGEFALYPEVAPVAVLPFQAHDEVFERRRVGTNRFAAGAELVTRKAGAGDRSGRAPLWPNRSSWVPLRTWTTAGSCSRRVADQGPVTRT